MIEKIYFDLSSLPKKKELSLTLGNFDGFHLGHQKLAFEAFSNSSKENAIFLFSSPYKTYFHNEPMLTDLHQRLVLAEQNRYESAYVLSSSEEAFALSAEEFEDLLRTLGASEIFVGEDYRYGKGAAGTPKTLIEAGFKVTIVPLHFEEGEKVASTKIKALIAEGKMEEAAKLLGRPYEISGKVIEGKRIGRTLGFPTANLGLDFPYTTPLFGAYAGRAFVRGVPRLSMISVGMNPTFATVEAPSIEAHILDFDEDIYGESISLSFYHLLRPSVRFDSKDELIRQLQKDEQSTRDYFLSLKDEDE